MVRRRVWETGSIYSTFPFVKATKTMMGRVCSSLARTRGMSGLSAALWLEVIGARSESETDLEEWNLRPYLLRDSGCFVDVGGSLGVQSKYASDHDMEVFVFEPNPRAVRILQRVVPEAHIYPFAVGSEDKDSVLLKLTPDYGHTKLATSSSKKDATDEVNVRMVRLDSMNLPKAGVVKIDTEGYELPVLQGASELIKRDKPRLVVEIHKPYERQELLIIRFLRTLGYSRIRQVWKPVRHQYHLVFFET